MILLVVLVIVSVYRLSMSSVNAGIQMQENTQETNGIPTAASYRRYSTSDEMRYILYGAGEQFSLYDRQLLDYIRSHVTQQSLTRPRRLKKMQNITDASQVGQSTFVDSLLSGRRDGFFIECGAADGESASNSLFFELQRNWTGLLIEANPDYYRALLDMNRRAYVLGSCLSTERRPATVRIQPAGILSGIADKMHPAHVAFIGSRKKQEVEANCFPLNAITAALGISHVDYLSLDVEGPELEILRTLDWTQLYVDVITVEYRIRAKRKIDTRETLKKLKDLRLFFQATGIYKEVGVLPRGSDVFGLDVVFSHTRTIPKL